MSILPDELIVDILSLLPVKSILRFRCVCKKWYDLFQNPIFLKNPRKHVIVKCTCRNIYMKHICFQTSLSSESSLLSSKSKECAEPIVEMDYPFKSQYDTLITVLDILGSSNGLILMNFVMVTDSTHAGIFLWNPSTMEYKVVPQPDRADSFVARHYGLGYSCIRDDYKIIRLDVSNITDKMRYYMWHECGGYEEDAYYGCRVNVYTLGSDSWKTLPNMIPYDIRDCPTNRTKPVLVNGSLHWVGTPADGQEFKTVSRVVVSFDLENDICTEVLVSQQLCKLLLPDSKEHSTAVSPNFNDILLGNLDGCLCILGGFLTDTYVIINIEIWVMKDYGVRDSWTKVFTVTRDSIERSINITMLSQMELMDFVNGKVLFTRDTEDELSLLIYDPKHEISWLVSQQGISICECQLETYVESLVSLNSGSKSWHNKKSIDRPRK